MYTVSLIFKNSAGRPSLCDLPSELQALILCESGSWYVAPAWASCKDLYLLRQQPEFIARWWRRIYEEQDEEHDEWANIGTRTCFIGGLPAWEYHEVPQKKGFYTILWRHPGKQAVSGARGSVACTEARSTTGMQANDTLLVLPVSAQQAQHVGFSPSCLCAFFYFLFGS